MSITRSSAASRTEGWHREDVKAAVRKGNSSLAALSRAEGLCTDAGHITLDRQWPRMERRIATFLGVQPWDIWPDRYTADHKPVRGWQPKREAAR